MPAVSKHELHKAAALLSPRFAAPRIAPPTRVKTKQKYASMLMRIKCRREYFLAGLGEGESAYSFEKGKVAYFL